VNSSPSSEALEACGRPVTIGNGAVHREPGAVAKHSSIEPSGHSDGEAVRLGPGRTIAEEAEQEASTMSNRAPGPAAWFPHGFRRSWSALISLCFGSG
jgi:hypothetical protein